MNKKKISIEIVVLLITSLWIAGLDFNNLKPIQLSGLGLTIIMIILMVMKLRRK